MTTNERHRVRPWLRVVSGVTGLAVAGAASLLLVVFLSVGQLHADDFIVLAVLVVPFLTAGLLFLLVGLVGHTPSWLPVHEPGTGRNVLLATLWLLAVIALGKAADVLEGWPRAHLGTGRGVSWFLSVLPSAIGFAVLLHYADRRKRHRAEPAPPAA